MQEYKFNKKSDVGKLKYELETAGFIVLSVATYENTTIVRLGDGETKDLTNVVNAHIYIKPETSDEYTQRIKSEFANAPSPDGKITVLAKYLGLL